MKLKIFAGFLIYGLLAGLISTWWWHHSDNMFLLNIPGELIGYEIYEFSIMFLGNPSSPQAHYTIPWALRIPQVFFPVSTIFWGMIGLILNLLVRRSER